MQLLLTMSFLAKWVISISRSAAHKIGRFDVANLDLQMIALSQRTPRGQSEGTIGAAASCAGRTPSNRESSLSLITYNSVIHFSIRMRFSHPNGTFYFGEMGHLSFSTTAAESAILIDQG